MVAPPKSDPFVWWIKHSIGHYYFIGQFIKQLALPRLNGAESVTNMTLFIQNLNITEAHCVKPILVMPRFLKEAPVIESAP